MLDVEAEDFSTPNRFRDRFGKLSPQMWEAVLVKSMTETVIDGVKFPRFPSADFQNSMHGTSGPDVIKEAVLFYRFIHGQPEFASCIGPEKTFLDFGCGWGRMSLPFLRDFDLANMFAYEPDIRFCTNARDVNPFIGIIQGGFLPDGRIPPSHFDLIVAWSVFSHLSRFSVGQWLTELARVMKENGVCVLTTSGNRFLNWLMAEQKRIDAGDEVHWYSKQVLKSAGDINQRATEYNNGEFVWFTDRDDGLYGDAFVPRGAIEDIIADQKLPLEIILFNDTDLVEDVFALRKIPAV